MRNSRDGMAKGDDIQARLVSFAVTVLNLCNEIPKSTAGMHIAGQLIRSGTSPAPNYAEARGAESLSDFIHKMAIVSKELNEPEVWLEILLQSRTLARDKLEPVQKECGALCRIIAAGRKTAASRQSNVQTRKSLEKALPH
jgi:four helix bundle protein